MLAHKVRKEKQTNEKKINLAMSDEQINEIVNHEIALEDSHPRQEKPKYFGEIIEQDGSIHLWFGDKKCCLHLAVDKATNTIVGAWFDKQETLNGYYHVFYQILTNYGIPYKFVTDNRTVFNYMSLNPDKRTSDKDVLTQFGYACKQLGTSIETTSVSQAKGLIERDNGTFQGRLVQKLRLNNITTIDEANKYLIEVFVPKFNSKFFVFGGVEDLYASIGFGGISVNKLMARLLDEYRKEYNQMLVNQAKKQTMLRRTQQYIITF